MIYTTFSTKTQKILAQLLDSLYHADRVDQARAESQLLTFPFAS